MRKIVATQYESPRELLFQEYSEMFDRNGLAVTQGAKALAVLLYQEAINQFLTHMPSELVIDGFRIKISAVSLIGSLGLLRARLGVWRPGIPFGEASRIYEKQSSGYLRYPSDADIRIVADVQGRRRPSAEAARKLAIEVYRPLWTISAAIFDYAGAYVHPCLDDREEFRLGLPIDVVKGRGLKTLYEIQRMNGPIED